MVLGSVVSQRQHLFHIYFQDVCKRPNIFGVFLDVDPSHLSLGLPYASRSLEFDLPLPH